MPYSSDHERKKGKNYALLACLVLLMAALFAVGYIRWKV